MRLALLLALLFCGCVYVPDVPPGPDVVPVADAATIDGLSSGFNASLRDAYRQSAGNVESGKWTTEEQLFDGERLLIDAAFDNAAQPLANRMQAEVGGKPLQEQAAFRRKIAEERP